ncbi:MAG TPA: TRAP transporter small permease [Solimonas sp.]|jgi:TRAP-type C4-dicarboxylate transport system permease small subunit|nr:TRAP transporter small permease [Solimonas sp.]
MPLLERLARLSALLAGALIVGVALLTCVSLIGRNTTGATLAGDFELTGVAAGAAIALFLPWCQLRRGHIIVDFFTARAGARTNALLDRFGALVLGLMLALIAWRCTVGGLSAWRNHSGTMMLNFPEWIVYALMVPPLGLAAVIAVAQFARGLGEVAE